MMPAAATLTVRAILLGYDNMIHTLFTYLKDNYAGQYEFTDVPYSYSNLQWLTGSKPTLENLSAAVDQLNADEANKQLRVLRDRLLADTDRYGLEDFPFKNNSEKTAWRTYRQALRDITNTNSPVVDSNGLLDASSVTWPSQPLTS